mgnify:CR=1 FL=1
MSMLPCVDEISCLNLHPLKSGPPTLTLVQREFRTNEGTTDYATIPEVTLAGDFVIEFLFSVSGAALNETILGQGASFFNYIHVRSDTEINARFNGTVLSFSVPSLGTDLHVASIKTTAGVPMLTLDGIDYPENTLLSYVGSVVFNVMSQKSGSEFLSGILANLKIYDAGTLVRNYPINDGKNILANAATALGNEIDGLTYALTTAIGGVASVVLSSLSVIGKTYLVEVSYSGVVGDASVRIGGFSGPSFTGTGTIEFVATATTTVNDILGALTGVTSGSVTVSIKEADGYGTIVNGNDDDWGLFDKQANGDWLGQELLFNGDFSQGASGWSGTVDTTIFADNKLYYNGTTNNVIYQNSISNKGEYLVTADIESFTRNESTPRPQFQVINNNGYQPITSGVAGLGSIYYDVSDASNPNSYFELGQFGSGAEFVVNSFSVKEVLKNAR